MSSFKCEFCGTDILDSPQGYTTECEHYPLVPQELGDFVITLQNKLTNSNTILGRMDEMAIITYYHPRPRKPIKPIGK